MIKAFLSGGAGINVLAGQVDAEVFVVDMGILTELDLDTLQGGNRLIIRKVANGTANLAKGPAMSMEQAVIAEPLSIGIYSVKSGGVINEAKTAARRAG